jgi:hypothetical protein
MHWPLFRALDHEWSSLHTRPTSQHAVPAWSADPVLAAFADPAAIVAALRAGATDPTAANHLLAALVARARHDTLAARTTLQALLPGLMNVAKRLAHRADSIDLEAQVLTEAVDLIRNYPLKRRPHAIAANITWDVFGRIARRGPILETPIPDPAPDLEHRADPSDEVNALLHDALDSGDLRPSDARLLAAIAIGTDTISTRAAREGTTYKAMNERWRRARNRLRTAIAA